MSAGTAFFPRPPLGPLWEALLELVRRYDPRTWAGAAGYGLFGIALGLAIGLSR